MKDELANNGKRKDATEGTPHREGMGSDKGEHEDWETLTTETDLSENIERDMIDLSTRDFEEKHGVKVPRGMYVISHDVFDLPRVSP